VKEAAHHYRSAVAPAFLRAILTTRPTWVGAAGKGGQMQSLRLYFANARKSEITAYVVKQ
jgi:hypothetical protein